MKRMLRVGFLAWLAACALAPRTPAATPIVGGSRDAMIEVVEIRRWVVGADALQLRRDVTQEGFPGELEGDWYGAFLGLRPTRWMLLYGALGRASADVGPDALGEGLGWSLGMHLRLWRYDLKDPEFLAGRWSVRAGGEFRRADSDGGHWQTASGSADLHFEMFADSPASTDRVPFSFALYAGPLYSALDGRSESGPIREDFEGESAWGVAAGAEVHLSHNFLLGLQLEFLDGTSWGLSARYTF
ncbi:MAG: hypothetical protein N2652_06135 [Kiritimatiellae bacterium]|nr:hypothetical protein [Kiritimatiellia bacterium]